jgi:hypothetical protein
MGQVEKFFVNQDQMALDAQKTTKRREEVLLSNIKYQLIGKLRNEGATKISIEAIEKKDVDFNVKAKFLLKGFKEGEFNFKINQMGNYIIKGFDLSIDNATLIKSNEELPIEMPEQKMMFDMSLIQAQDIGENKYQISYPTVGEIGILSKDNSNDVESVKKLCSMASDFYGMKSEFVNDFKLNMTDGANNITASDKTSLDPMVEVQKELKSFSKHNTDEKEKNQLTTLRENFIQSITMKAKNMVKQLTTTYGKGSPKILSADTVLEYIDNKFDGTVIVRAQFGKDIISYGLPVVKNNIVLKGNINETYKIKREDFIDDLNKKINSDISESLKLDMELLQADMNNDVNKTSENLITSARVSDIQKSYVVDKHFVPEGTEIGSILNLSAGKYEVSKENDSLFRLTLVS